MSEKYTLLKISATDYQLEDPDGNVLVTGTYGSQPAVPEGIVADIIAYAYDSSTAYDDAYMRELSKMQLLGFRFIDDS